MRNSWTRNPLYNKGDVAMGSHLQNHWFYSMPCFSRYDCYKTITELKAQWYSTWETFVSNSICFKPGASKQCYISNSQNVQVWEPECRGSSSPYQLHLITPLSNFCFSILPSCFSGFNSPSVLERNVYTRCIKSELVAAPGHFGFLMPLSSPWWLRQ